MVKRQLSIKKISIFVFILLLIIGLIWLAILLLPKNKEENVEKVKKIDTIEGYDYVLNSNSTKYYKSLFKELKTVLEKDQVDEDKYAELVTKLFIADFYNLDNKISKNDIGGEGFVYKNYREEFKKLATDSIYKTVENNIYKDRKQKLPIVSKVEVQKISNEAFKYNEQTDEKAYKMTFDITYKNDLDYQKNGIIILLHNDKKLEVGALESSEN